MTRVAANRGWPRLESVWPTSLLFSLVLLGGYRVLERRGFLLLITAVGLWHLLVCIRFAPRPSSKLILSQSLVAVATIVAVVLHVLHVAGRPPTDLGRMVRSFALAELKQASTYLAFCAYLLVFALAVAALLLFARLLKLRSEMTASLFLSTAVAGSAVNLAFDYSLTQPLYHVSGEPGAEAFFFAAGLFGLEFSLPLHLLLLLTSYAISVRAHRIRRVSESQPR